MSERVSSAPESQPRVKNKAPKTPEQKEAKRQRKELKAQRKQRKQAEAEDAEKTQENLQALKNELEGDTTTDSVAGDNAQALNLYRKTLLEHGFAENSIEASNIRKALGLEPVMTTEEQSQFDRALRMESGFAGKMLLKLSGGSDELQRAKQQLQQLQQLRDELRPNLNPKATTEE